MLVISYIFNQLIQLYIFVIFAAVIMSWLISFNVINRRNQFVDSVWRAVNAMTEPALRPIRNFLPNLGGLDISPIILILLIMLIQRVILYYIYPNVI